MPVISRKITSSPIGVADYNSLNPGDNNTTKLHLTAFLNTYMDLAQSLNHLVIADIHTQPLGYY